MNNIVDEIIGIDVSQHISDKLKQELAALITQYQDPANPEWQKTIVLSQVPAVLQVTQICNLDNTILRVQKDRQLLQTLLKVYTTMITTLDAKLCEMINSVGNQAIAILDTFPDGGFQVLSPLLFYYYPGSEELKKNKYVRYILWTNLFICSIFIGLLILVGFILIYDPKFKLGKIYRYSSVTKIGLGLSLPILILGSIAPQAIYYFTVCSNSLGRAFRSLFVGATPPINQHLQEQFDETVKDILSVRADISSNLSKIIHLTMRDQYQTYYSTYINSFEMIDAITRHGTLLNDKDRNILLTLLSFSDYRVLLTAWPVFLNVLPMYLTPWGIPLMCGTIFFVGLQLGLQYVIGALVGVAFPVA